MKRENTIPFTFKPYEPEGFEISPKKIQKTQKINLLQGRSKNLMSQKNKKLSNLLQQHPNTYKPQNLLNIQKKKMPHPQRLQMSKN